MGWINLRGKNFQIFQVFKYSLVLIFFRPPPSPEHFPAKPKLPLFFFSFLQQTIVDNTPLFRPAPHRKQPTTTIFKLRQTRHENDPPFFSSQTETPSSTTSSDEQRRSQQFQNSEFRRATIWSRYHKSFFRLFLF